MARTMRKQSGADLSRLRRFAQNHLGTIMMDQGVPGGEFRDAVLDVFDAYYEGRQYDDLMDWDAAVQQEEYVPIRQRKPRVVYNVAKVLVDKVASKLVGSATFPAVLVEDDDDDTAFYRTVMKASQFRKNMIDPIKHTLISGAVFVRYYLVANTIKMEYAKSKYCYPTFDAAGELEEVLIKYVYEDQQDRDNNGKARSKWYQLKLTKLADIAYDNPDYKPGVKPEFKEVGRAEHGLGWVQGEWFVTHGDKFDYDGASLFGDVLSFIDELNYSMSQSSQASQYNQEPQLVVNGMSEDEMNTLIKSSQKGWNLGEKGEAKYLETDLAGVTAVGDLREKFKTSMLDVVRIVLHNPEKMEGQAQSGEALKQLYGPLLELVDELRAVFEPSLKKLLLKISMTLLHCNAMGEETALEIPPGYLPQSTDLTIQWPNIFPPTLADLASMATALNTLTTAQIVSRETATRFIAANTSIIEDVDEELKKIESQEPLPSAFGTFGGE